MPHSVFVWGIAVAHQQTILVVGLVAADDAPTTFMSLKAFDDFDYRTVYEVVVRLKLGKPLPARLMTMVTTQDELLKLVRAVDGRNIRLAVITDERTLHQPQTVEALLAKLPISNAAPCGEQIRRMRNAE